MSRDRFSKNSKDILKNISSPGLQTYFSLEIQLMIIYNSNFLTQGNHSKRRKLHVFIGLLTCPGESLEGSLSGTPRGE